MPSASVKPLIPSSPTLKSKPASITPSKNTAQVKNCHAGLINKGNTGYANSILQALPVVPALRAQWSSESSQLSPLVKSISLNMSLLKRSSSSLDPSNFLRALAQKVSINRGIQFDFNTQQDVPEILEVILDELIGLSPLADSILSSSLNRFLRSVSLSGDDQWLCPTCSVKRESSKEYSISSCGKVLIVQLKRFSRCRGSIIKDTKLVHCLPEPTHILTVPVHSSDSVSFSNRYSLIATINHSGTLQAGHYWAFIKDASNNTWLKCKDRSVITVPPSALNKQFVLCSILQENLMLFYCCISFARGFDYPVLSL